MRSLHIERHRADRIGWLRAAVLGANDGLVSVASLVVGVAAGGAEPATVLLAGMAGLAAGAMSMAAGEYVSVRSQADTEHADLERERRELIEDPAHELDELTEIYVSRGLDEPLARQVAERFTAVDALGAHARDELGITDTLRARPAQAALASALAFALGALLPVLAAVLAPTARAGIVIVVTTLAALLLLGATAAWAGGAAPLRGALRVTFWGAIAMALTAGVGRLFDIVA
ncbi:MAG: membrane protein [Gammaproteobacteria bacterium]|nr:VIT family protein [Gammaproteobacteria bacterium]MCE7895625.1 VIT family protein [Gammaproteobacteria bacterium PRO8]MCL4776600.1 VIT1/CCC1 transporter family protein [Gammaproteobacteria bacterium]MDL1880878.1 VIT family protein [Gammaproteobacteria bacterium PRO2]GIK34757.1 MAG: membrane protein [Gammaproteobacteria bacterium]